jgi:hypothetical protein
MQEAKYQQVNTKNTYDSRIMHLEINDIGRNIRHKRENVRKKTWLAKKSFTFV